MEETHVCVVTRNGAVVHEAKVPSTPASIAAALAPNPACRCVLFETGRMAPMLYHGLSRLGLPVVCVESRQAYQALKSLATHKTDRNRCTRPGASRTYWLLRQRAEPTLGSGGFRDGFARVKERVERASNSCPQRGNTAKIVSPKRTGRTHRFRGLIMIEAGKSPPTINGRSTCD